MAITKDVLFTSYNLNGPYRYHSKRQISDVIGPVSGAPNLPALTPLALNTSTNKWAPFDSDGLNDTDLIRGFLHPLSSGEMQNDNDGNGLATSATDDTPCIIITEGQVHRDDVPLIGAENQTTTDAGLRALIATNNNLTVQGLAGAV